MKLLVLCIFASIALASAEESNKRCDVPCTRIYLPVCGTDGQHFKTFSNECVMKNEHCKDGRNWSQVRMSDCDKAACEKPCTRELDPICGTDGQHYKIFPNRCVFNNQHCTDGKAWKEARFMFCAPKPQSAPLEECGTPCTREYRPVCGFNGQTHKMFSNVCVMKNEYCHDGHKWMQTKMSECMAKFEMEAVRKCERPCTREYDPICGYDGKSYKMFSNPCVFRNQHCRDGKTWTEVGMRMCQQNTEVESTEFKMCGKPCTRELDPICGTDGQQYIVFPNKCVFNNAHCTDGRNWSQVRMSDCNKATCEKPCTRELDLVCGTDGQHYKIFPNRCVFNNQHCTDGKAWKEARFVFCAPKPQSAPLKECGTPCTREYRPVCGFDGVRHKIFSNPCVLRNAHCVDGKDWTQTRMENCSEETDA